MTWSFATSAWRRWTAWPLPGWCVPSPRPEACLLSWFQPTTRKKDVQGYLKGKDRCFPPSKKDCSSGRLLGRKSSMLLKREGDESHEAGKSAVLLADDSPTIRKALTMLLSQDPRLEVIGTARDGEEVLQMARFLKPDVLSMDVQMPKLDGLEATRQIMAACPCPIVVVSSHSEDAEMNLSFNAIQAGAVEITGKPKTSRGGSTDLRDMGHKRLADLLVRVGEMPLRLSGHPSCRKAFAPRTGEESTAGGVRLRGLNRGPPRAGRAPQAPACPIADSPADRPAHHRGLYRRVPKMAEPVLRPGGGNRRSRKSPFARPGLPGARRLPPGSGPGLLEDTAPNGGILPLGGPVVPFPRQNVRLPGGRGGVDRHGGRRGQGIAGVEQSRRVHPGPGGILLRGPMACRNSPGTWERSEKSCFRRISPGLSPGCAEANKLKL